MSTANFKPMKYGMPMVCSDLDFDEQKKQYEEETGEEYTEYHYYDDLDYMFEDAAQLAENFTENLRFHKVTVESGYYFGFQFYVSEKYEDEFDLNADSRYCIDNDDARYYFDMYRSQVLRAADAEKRRIEKWLESLNGTNGMYILVCTGRFSSGEATYGRRDNKRELLKSVCRGLY